VELKTYLAHDEIEVAFGKYCGRFDNREVCNLCTELPTMDTQQELIDTFKQWENQGAGPHDRTAFMGHFILGPEPDIGLEENEVAWYASMLKALEEQDLSQVMKIKLHYSIGRVPNDLKLMNNFGSSAMITSALTQYSEQLRGLFLAEYPVQFPDFMPEGLTTMEGDGVSAPDSLMHKIKKTRKERGAERKAAAVASKAQARFFAQAKIAAMKAKAGPPAKVGVVPLFPVVAGPPAKDGSVPAKDGGVPAQDGGVPAKDGGNPAKDGGVPAKDGGVPAKDGVGAPAKDGAVPAKDGGVPPKDGGVPAKDGSVLAKEAGPPPKTGAVPAKEAGPPPKSPAAKMGNNNDDGKASPKVNSPPKSKARTN
jgi:hypothetical protein